MVLKRMVSIILQAVLSIKGNLTQLAISVGMAYFITPMAKFVTREAGLIIHSMDSVCSTINQ